MHLRTFKWPQKPICKTSLGLMQKARTHFMGKVPYDVYRKVLQVSAAHVYLTYPFVLSWSMLEATASLRPSTTQQPCSPFGMQHNIPRRHVTAWLMASGTSGSC